MLDEYRIIKGKADSGDDVYIYYDKKGRKVPLNSMYSPEKEAEKYTAKITTKDKVVFLVGIGNGALVKHWTRSRYDFVHLFIIEPYEDIKLDRELTEIIEKNRNISFFYYKNSSATHISSLFGSFIGIEMDLIVHPNYEKTCAPYMMEVISEIKNAIKIHKINVNTTFVFRKDWILEPLLNLKYTFNITPIEELKGKFAGEKAVLVASGPSLEDLMPTVKKLQKSSYIFAAGSAMNGLLNNGIAPDFVAVFDSSDRNYEAHFKNSKYTGPLIIGSVVNSKILETHRGDAVLACMMIDDITKRARPELTSFSAFPSVALFTFYLISYLGFSEIYLVGQDLALVKDRYYAKGVHEHEASRDLKADLYVESNDGSKVGTTYSLYSFLQSLENTISSLNSDLIKVYNLSKKGAKIKGAKFIECEDINLSGKRKKIDLNLKPKISSKESFDKISEIMSEILDLYLETKKMNKLMDGIVNNKRITIKNTEKAVKALRKLRSHSILEEAITPQLSFQMRRINNVTEFLIKDDNGREERKLLIDELNKSIKMIYSLLIDIINDQRFKSLFVETDIKYDKKYEKIYET